MHGVQQQEVEGCGGEEGSALLPPAGHGATPMSYRAPPGGLAGLVWLTERVLIETEDGLFRIRARSKYGIQTDGSYSYLS